MISTAMLNRRALISAMKKVLVTGGSGLLGSNCIHMLKTDCRVTGIYNRHPVSIKGAEMIQADLTDKDRTTGLVASLRPDIIIHCAAITDVDLCERESEKAWQVNVKCPALLAALAMEQGTSFVHISSDAVYGKGDGNATEQDETMAVNAYARTKIEAEREVLRNNPDALILRSAIYGWNMRNRYSFGEAILRALIFNRSITLFHDVFFTPILVNDLVEIIMELSDRKARGIFNAGAVDSPSKLDFGRMLAGIFGFSGENIVPVSLMEKNLAAERPKRPTMNVDKITSFLGRKMPSTENGLQRFRQLLLSGYVARMKPGATSVDELKRVWQ
jgi:dTDP-4-dehydrorhamnose reductase